jgi:hypothetical protein
VHADSKILLKCIELMARKPTVTIRGELETRRWEQKPGLSNKEDT